MCDHKRTAVKSSRSPDYIRADGKPLFAAISYPCVMVRRRHCLDCDERITTVEVPKEYMDTFSPEKMRRHIVNRLKAMLEADAV